MNHEEGTLATDDGLDLYWQSWQPPGTPEGVLLFVHGLAEHSGRYLNPVRHFVARGWTCFGFDYRGHGKSPGPRVHVGSFGEFLDDLLARSGAEAAAAHAPRRFAGAAPFWRPEGAAYPLPFEGPDGVRRDADHPVTGVTAEDVDPGRYRNRTPAALPVGEISKRLGFQSVYYFSELFKRRMACSPTAYRKKCRPT